MDQTIDQRFMGQQIPPPPRRKKKMLIALAIVVILAGGFAVYWFYFRDTSISEQDKLDILEELRRSSKIEFTPQGKDQILTNLSSESRADNPAAANMTEEQKLSIINSLGGQK